MLRRFLESEKELWEFLFRWWVERKEAFWRNLILDRLSENLPEYLSVGLLLAAMIALTLYMMGARGRVAQCIYWAIALLIALKILF
jgi:hypothetical protein